MRILLVEDDPLLGDGVETALKREGYQVEWLHDGASALETLAQGEFGAVVLDLGLPGMDGMEVLRRLRETQSLPVVILTARDSLDDKVMGLDAGADDYVLKPFELEELLARLRMVMRRAVGRTTQVLTVNDLTIDESRHEVTWKDKPVKLGRREYALLLELANNAGQVLTRPHLEQLLYGWDDEVESNALEVHIHHLRKKLAPELIVTLRGIGYRLEDNAR
ncbi:response regulator [Halotalea alkalilenta]|uniref:DNA-binding response regulator n=1 Tax=Halotalea alkalilenta TaxID=376489 RepID=A0A172YET3_9GAMM|nr:response regulator transcription factor [Halotalea alkalilenta]ANF57768.1 DNA-binding response regulator [Halotalea alkalilenta]